MKGLSRGSSMGGNRLQTRVALRPADVRPCARKAPKRRSGWRGHAGRETDLECNAARLSRTGGREGGVVVLTRVVERLRGLKSAMASSRGSYAVLVPCCDIHTFGMKFPIDVAFVDERGMVLAALRRVSPARRLRCGKARMVLERRSSDDAWFEPGQAVFASPR